MSDTNVRVYRIGNVWKINFDDIHCVTIRVWFPNCLIAISDLKRNILLSCFIIVLLSWRYHIPDRMPFVNPFRDPIRFLSLCEWENSLLPARKR